MFLNQLRQHLNRLNPFQESMLGFLSFSVLFSFGNSGGEVLACSPSVSLKKQNKRRGKKWNAALLTFFFKECSIFRPYVACHVLTDSSAIFVQYGHLPTWQEPSAFHFLLKSWVWNPGEGNFVCIAYLEKIRRICQRCGRREVSKGCI